MGYVKCELEKVVLRILLFDKKLSLFQEFAFLSLK